MKIKILELEKSIGYTIKRNFKSVGIDTAQTSGVAFLKSDDEYVHIDSLVLGFKTKDKKEIYESMIKTFAKLFNDENMAIIEEVFVGFSRAGSVELAKYGAFAISECVKKDIPYETISAVSARAKFKINTQKYRKGKSKLAVADFLKSIKIDVVDDNIADAIVLSLIGLCKEIDFNKIKPTKNKTTKKRKSSWRPKTGLINLTK